MDIMLSVIVPIYNAHDTIHRCLDSILQEQQIKLEVICVNDESTDDSLSICQEYQKRDNRVVIVDKKNGGVASARNSGLEIARGKYITFVDQDDWVEKDAYFKLIKKGLEENADMVVFNYSKDYEQKIQPMINRGVISENIASTEELIKYAFFREEYRGFAAFVWNKLFKKELLNRSDIMFEDTLRRGDDVLFYTRVAVCEPKTVYMNEHFYHYVQRSDSITHTLTKENLERLSEILIGYERAINVIEERFEFLASVSYMKCFYVYHAYNLYKIAQKENIEDKKAMLKKAMKKYLAEYKKQNKDYIERIKSVKDAIKED